MNAIKVRTLHQALHASQNTYWEARYRDASVIPSRRTISLVTTLGHLAHLRVPMACGQTKSIISLFQLETCKVCSQGNDLAAQHNRAQPRAAFNCYHTTPPAPIRSAYPIPGVQGTIQQPYRNSDQRLRSCFNAWSSSERASQTTD